MTAPRVPIETLLNRATWIRSLALELVGDPHRADDLVQETWVRALERPPRASGSLSAWLARVMRNVARQDWRSAESREARERGRHAAGAAEAAQDVVARAQGQRQLVEAVLELDERYGAVLLMRYFDELDTGVIAQRLGISRSTVRTRQQRGLELLRERIEARHGEDARQWLSALAFVGLPGREVGSAAALGTRSWLALAAVVCVVTQAALFAWWAFGGPDAARVEQLAGGRGPAAAIALVGAGEENEQSSAPDEPRDPGRRSLDGASGAAAARAAAVVTARNAAAVTHFTVRVDGAPAAAGTVYLSKAGWVDEDPTGVDPALRAPLDADGRARFVGVTGSVNVAAVRLLTGGVLQKSIHGATDELVLELGTARIDGVVWDADGQPARGVRVMLGMKIGWDYGALTAIRATDARGRFSIEHLPATDFWVHAELPGTEEARVHGELTRGEQRIVELGAPTGLVTLEGRVLTVVGEPLVGHLPNHASGRIDFVREDQGARTVRPVRLGEDGTYFVRLAPGAYTARVVSHTSVYAKPLGQVAVAQDATLDFVLRGARVEAHAFVLGAGRRLDPALDGEVVLTLSRVVEVGGAERTLTHDARIGADGRAVFDGVRAGRWILSGARLAESAPVEVDVLSEDTVSIDVAVAER